MNWTYEEAEGYYIDPKGVRFHFQTYRKRQDTDGFVPYFKEYQAGKMDENFREIPAAFTLKGHFRKILVKPA
jgi:transposase